MERPAAFPVGGGNRYLSPIPTAASFPTGFVTSGVEAMCVDHISRLKATGFPSPCSIAPNAGLLFPGSGCIAGPYIRSAPGRTETSPEPRSLHGPWEFDQCWPHSGRQFPFGKKTVAHDPDAPCLGPTSVMLRQQFLQFRSHCSLDQPLRSFPERFGQRTGNPFSIFRFNNVILHHSGVFPSVALKSGRQQINPIRRSSSIPQTLDSVITPEESEQGKQCTRCKSQSSSFTARLATILKRPIT